MTARPGREDQKGIDTDTSLSPYLCIDNSLSKSRESCNNIFITHLQSPLMVKKIII